MRGEGECLLSRCGTKLPAKPSLVPDDDVTQGRRPRQSLNRQGNRGKSGTDSEVNSPDRPPIVRTAPALRVKLEPKLKTI
jgi:hypothetical protein